MDDWETKLIFYYRLWEVLLICLTGLEKRRRSLLILLQSAQSWTHLINNWLVLRYCWFFKQKNVFKKINSLQREKKNRRYEVCK